MKSVQNLLSKLFIPRHIGLAVVIIVSLAAISPLVRTINKINTNDDFLQLATRHLLVRNSIINDHQMPMRTNYLGGGYPTIADPEDPTLSPFVLLTIMFGEIAGLKLIAVILFLTGAISMYYFARNVLKFNYLGAVFSALALSLSGWFPKRVNGGNINELYFFLTPLALLLFEKYLADKKYLLLVSVILAAIAMDGKIVFPVMMLFLFCYAVIQGIEIDAKKIVVKKEYFKGYLFVLFSTLLLAAVKIIPVLTLFKMKGAFLFPTIDSHNHAVVFGRSEDLIAAIIGPPGKLYIGVVVFVLFVLVSSVYFKRHFKWLLAGLICIFMYLGPNGPLDIFYSLWKLPLVNTMDKPNKYLSYFILFITAAVGGGFFEFLKDTLKKNRVKFYLIGSAIVCAAIAPLFLFSFSTYTKTFDMIKTPVKKYEFSQMWIGNEKVSGGSMYFNLLRNTGTIDWYGAIKLPENAVPKVLVKDVDNKPDTVLNPAYKGEVFFVTSGGDIESIVSTGVEMRPNSIKLNVKADRPGTIVINQNYQEGWKAYGDHLLAPYKGLLGVKISSPGDYKIDLRYGFPGFYWGLIISFLTFIILLLKTLFVR